MDILNKITTLVRLSSSFGCSQLWFFSSVSSFVFFCWWLWLLQESCGFGCYKRISIRLTVLLISLLFFYKLSCSLIMNSWWRVYGNLKFVENLHGTRATTSLKFETLKMNFQHISEVFKFYFNRI